MKILDYRQMLKLPAGLIVRVAQNKDGGGGSYVLSPLTYVTTGKAAPALEVIQNDYRLSVGGSEMEHMDYGRFERAFLDEAKVSNLTTAKPTAAVASEIEYTPRRFYLVYGTDDLNALLTRLLSARDAAVLYEREGKA